MAQRIPEGTTFTVLGATYRVGLVNAGNADEYAVSRPDGSVGWMLLHNPERVACNDLDGFGFTCVALPGHRGVHYASSVRCWQNSQDNQHAHNLTQ